VTSGPAPVFFVDRNLGRRVVPGAMRAAGLLVEVMDEHFDPATPDEVWLRAVGDRGWFVVTRDQRLRYRGVELAAIEEAGVGVFVIAGTAARTGPEVAETIVRAKDAILTVTLRRERPFIAKVYANGRVVVWHDFER